MVSLPGRTCSWGCIALSDWRTPALACRAYVATVRWARLRSELNQPRDGVSRLDKSAADLLNGALRLSGLHRVSPYAIQPS